MKVQLKTIEVGRFFEVAGQQLVGGELVRNDDGDIYVGGQLNAMIEVKASGYQSSYGYRLDQEQLDRGVESIPFPYDRRWYVLIAYRNKSSRNPKTGKRRAELSYHKKARAIHEYLASAVMECLLVDISIVARWKATLNVSTKSLRGRLGTRTTDVKCRMAHELANGGMREGLIALGLDPSDYRALESEISLTATVDDVQHRLKFPLTAILPSEEIPRLQRLLRRQGFAANKRTP